MKKSFLIITAIILIIIFIVLGYIFEAQSKQNEAISYNKQYENYLGKEIYGAEIATLIKKSAGSLLLNTEVFDVYTGKGIEENKKSIAYNFRLL